jgi:CubicO group peptidase (beta-lactamase class C family)
MKDGISGQLRGVMAAREEAFRAELQEGSTEMAVCALADGDPVWEKTYTAARDGQNAAAGAQRLWPLGSQTKTLTAVAVMKLVEAGRLRLDDPIVRFFPNASIPPEAPLAKVSVRDALGHRGGFAFDAEPAIARATPDALPALDAYLERYAYDLGPTREAAYSNVGYWVLGRLVERVSGQDLTTFIRDNIISRLDAPLITDLDSVPPDRLVPSMTKDGPQAPSNKGWFLAAGGWYGSSEAIARFYHALFNGKILEPTLVERMKNDSAPFLYQGKPLEGAAYGLGLLALDVGDHRAFGHPGSWQTCRALTLWDSATNTTLSLNANGSAAGRGVLATFLPIAQDVLGALSPNALDPAPARPGVAQQAHPKSSFIHT